MKIEALNISHSYPSGATNRQVLQNINLVITERRVGIVGHNGCGKSTFVRMINGLVQPISGKVIVAGLDSVKKASQIRKEVGFLFTDPDAQIIMPTVAEDIAFGLRKTKLSKQEKARLVEQLMERFGLSSYADHPAHLLSGGQKQLLALAAVLITQPRLIIMDEPTTLLDLRNALLIKRIIAELDQQVILVTHQLEQLTDFDRVIVFDQGKVVADDQPDKALAIYRELIMA